MEAGTARDVEVTKGAGEAELLRLAALVSDAFAYEQEIFEAASRAAAAGATFAEVSAIENTTEVPRRKAMRFAEAMLEHPVEGLLGLLAITDAIVCTLGDESVLDQPDRHFGEPSPTERLLFKLVREVRRLKPSARSTHTKAPADADAELLTLAETLDEAFVREREAVERAERLEAGSDAWPAASDEGDRYAQEAGVIADKLVSLPADTIPGLAAKATAYVWCFAGEDGIVRDIREGEPATSELLAHSIIADVLRMNAARKGSSDAPLATVAELLGMHSRALSGQGGERPAAASPSNPDSQTPADAGMYRIVEQLEMTRAKKLAAYAMADEANARDGRMDPRLESECTKCLEAETAAIERVAALGAQSLADVHAKARAVLYCCDYRLDPFEHSDEEKLARSLAADVLRLSQAAASWAAKG